MSLHNDLRRELESLGWRVGVLLGPDAALDLQQRLSARAELIAATLTDDTTDDSIRADTVMDILSALFGDADPPDEWWQTPTGQATARSLGSAQARSWTHSVAAAHLGVTRGTIAQLTHRGTIDKHPDGGVVPADVVRYGRERRGR